MFRLSSFSSLRQIFLHASDFFWHWFPFHYHSSLLHHFYLDYRFHSSFSSLSHFLSFFIFFFLLLHFQNRFISPFESFLLLLSFLHFSTASASFFQILHYYRYIFILHCHFPSFSIFSPFSLFSFLFHFLFFLHFIDYIIDFPSITFFFAFTFFIFFFFRRIFHS